MAVGSRMDASAAKTALLSITLVAAGTASAGERFTGEAHAPDGGALLYREEHLSAGDRHVVVYRCANGDAFARKRLDVGAAGRHSPDVDFEDARTGHRHGVRSRGGAREAWSRDAGGTEKREALPSPPPVVDAGFDPWLRDMWPAPGKSVSTAFVAPGRLSPLPFRAEALRDADGVRSFRLVVDAWYGGIAPEVDVDYAIDGKRLLRYRGISDITDARGRMRAVDIRFPADARGTADAAMLEAALAAPLVKDCEGGRASAGR